MSLILIGDLGFHGELSNNPGQNSARFKSLSKYLIHGK